MQFTKSKQFKTAMKYLYGWGASVVIIGAMFKINHFSGAREMLIVGLSLEALIFFVSVYLNAQTNPIHNNKPNNFPIMYSKEVHKQPTHKHRFIKLHT